MLAGRSLLLFAATAGTLGTAPASAQRAGPSNVTVTELKGGAVVSWRGVRDASVSYRVLRGPDPVKPGQDLTKPLPADATSYNDELPVIGTVYYTVVAVYGDGSQGASTPVQFPAAATAAAPAALMPPATVPSRSPSGMSPKLGAAPVLRATTVSSTWHDFWVTLTWAPVLTAAPEPITYVVRHSPYDPAKVPSSYQPGFVGVTPMLNGGVMRVRELTVDRENPSWYMVVATSTSQGTVNFPWYRQDPPPHRGVDTIIGHYWHTGMGSNGKWAGCVLGSLATDAMAYVARVKAGSAGWVTIHTAPPVTNKLAGAGMNVAYFDTGHPEFQTLATALNGGYVPQFQMWPLVNSGGNTVGYAWSAAVVADTMHLQPLVSSVTQSQTPLNPTTCS